jgi:CheY-like chemotaxis protein
MEYRILIVAEDAPLRHRYAEALIAAPPAAGVGYKITTTGSAAAAQLQATRQPFNLMIAAVQASGDGLSLAARLHELYPAMRLILAGNGLAKSLQHEAAALGARLVERDVPAAALCGAVAEQLGLVRPACAVAGPEAAGRPPATLADVQLLLDVMRRQARAQVGFYGDSIGNVIAQCGDLTGVDVPSLTSLIAGGFVNSVELGRVLRDPETIHLSVHEGAYFDIYSTNVGSSRLIALLFDKQIAEPRLGMVWLLMKRAAEQLRRMNVVEQAVEDMLSDELSASLNREFDRLFGNELDYAA